MDYRYPYTNFLDNGVADRKTIRINYIHILYSDHDYNLRFVHISNDPQNS